MSETDKIHKLISSWVQSNDWAPSRNRDDRNFNLMIKQAYDISTSLDFNIFKAMLAETLESEEPDWPSSQVDIVAEKYAKIYENVVQYLNDTQ